MSLCKLLINSLQLQNIYLQVERQRRLSLSDRPSVSTAPTHLRAARRIDDAEDRNDLHLNYATASDLPVEIIVHIINFFKLKSEISPYDYEGLRNFVPCSKRELGFCALVWRSWTDICQEHIFRHVTLRSRQDLSDLLAFASLPGSQIPEFVHKLTAVVKGPSTPWLHLVCQNISRSRCVHGVRFPNLDEESGVSFKLEGPFGTEIARGGIHWGLPRCLPVFSRGLEDLTLTDIKLRRLSDVTKLAKELSSLRVLRCRSLSWETLPSQESEFSSIVPTRSRVPGGLTIWMEECGVDFPIACALNGGEYGICSEDFDAMCRFSIAITSSIEWSAFRRHVRSQGDSQYLWSTRTHGASDSNYLLQACVSCTVTSLVAIQILVPHFGH